MEKVRLEIYHYIREKIVLDVELPDRGMLDDVKNDIYAQACEMPGWSFDWDAGPTTGVTRVEEISADHFDTPADGILRLGEDGIEVLEFTPEVIEPQKARRLRGQIERALRDLEGCCLDDEDDRKKVVDTLLKELG